MIVISAGMEKSGSAFCFNLINDLLITANKNDVRKIKKRYHLESMLELKNCNIRELTWKKLMTLTGLHFLGKTFVVKTHFPPTGLLKFLIVLKIMKAIYIYRDPRDVILSAIDHGSTQRAKGNLSEYFVRFVSIENSISIVKDYLVIWDQWVHFKRVLLLKYEDVASNTMTEINRITHYLKLNIRLDDKERILKKYRPEHAKNLDFPVHLNVAKAGRYRNQMSPAEKNTCRKHLGDYLKKMGYPADDR